MSTSMFGINERACWAKYESPVGEIVILADGEAIVGLYFVGQKYCVDFAKMQYDHQNALIRRTEAWLDEYFRGRRPDPRDIPLRMEGSGFQAVVWRFLRGIPYGEVRSYGEIARRVARELGREQMSAQAVGGAVGRNPISIIVPCHRVVGVGGKLVGYAGGTERKRKLLELEGWGDVG